jgi:SAM-dependent methyltransferase
VDARALLTRANGNDVGRRITLEVGTLTRRVIRPIDERGVTSKRVRWSSERAGDWASCIESKDRARARALYEELGSVLVEEMDETGGDPVLSVPEVNDRIRQHLDTVSGTRALDVGCGPTPVAALALADRGFATVAVDIAESIVQIASRFEDTGVAVAVADAERLPFATGSFDVVTCDDTIEHVFDQEALIAGVARVLRPGGRFLLVTPNASALHVLRARALDLARGRNLPREHYHITQSHVRELRWTEILRLVKPHFELRSAQPIPYRFRGRAGRVIARALRSRAMWRWGPIHFLDLQRRPDVAGSSAQTSSAQHYAGRIDVESQMSPPAVREALRQHVPMLTSEGPVLDLGTGGGWNLAALGEDRVFGCDVSMAALRRAGDRSVLAADGALLPFPDRTFGAVVCTEVLEHVDDPAAVFAEIARVLRPEGVAYVTTPNYANVAGLHKWIADRRSGRTEWNPWNSHEGGYEAFMTGRRLRAAAQQRLDFVSVRGLDFGQALTGRFGSLDRAAWSGPGRRLLDRLLPVLHDPRWPLLPWHAMHVELVFRKPRDPK